MVQIISIDGNIGSGKSTFVQKMKQEFNDNNKIIFIDEPVDEWSNICDKNGETILSKFYKNQTKYAFSFQMMAFISRLNKIKSAYENNPDSIIITERSIYTDKYVFAKMLYDDDKMEEVEYKIYLQWFDSFAKDFPIEKIVYIKTDPEVCLERIAKRRREGEAIIPLEYLKNCHLYHEKMIECESLPINNIESIDGNENIFETIVQQKWLDKLDRFISNSRSDSMDNEILTPTLGKTFTF